MWRLDLRRTRWEARGPISGLLQHFRGELMRASTTADRQVRHERNVLEVKGIRTLIDWVWNSTEGPRSASLPGKMMMLISGQYKAQLTSWEWSECRWVQELGAT